MAAWQTAPDGAVKGVGHVILYKQALKGNFADVRNAWDYMSFSMGGKRKKKTAKYLS